MLEYIKNHKRNLLILIVLIVAQLFLYSRLYGFRFNNDTDSFIMSFEFFRGNESNIHPPRYLNPFYPLVGSTFFGFLSSAHALIVMNIIFYFGMVLLTYDLVRRVFKNNAVGFLSAMMVMTSYAIIRYGLTQVQDIGGYFWFLLTLYCGWRWWEENDRKWLIVGGIATAFGILTKESGAMGALFVGIIMIVKNWKELKKLLINFTIFSIWPAVTILVNWYRGKDVQYNSLQWFKYAWTQYGSYNYTFFKFFSINLSTFNIAWVAIGIGLVFLYRNRKQIDRNVWLYLLAAIPSSLSYFAWSLFISRTVFISAWLVLPIAAYGIYELFSVGYKKISVILFIFIITVPYLLQSMIGYTPLFVIIERCNYKVPCSLNSFIKSRNHFSNFILNSPEYLEQ